jgi:hypothetical protein
VKRNTFKNRGSAYTDKAVMIRCARLDQSAITIRVYYLQHGSATLGFSHRRQEFLIPIGIVIKVHGVLFYFKTPTTPLSGPYKCLSKAGWDALIFKARKIGSGREQGTYIHC